MYIHTYVRTYVHGVMGKNGKTHMEGTCSSQHFNSESNGYCITAI